jgi:hypothetical protein
MNTRFLTVGFGALALTTTLFTFTGCKPKAASATKPTAFTAELTELPGVQAVYTLRHPKLINADLEKLMTAVPEAALARMFLGQLTAYGYPEFTELAADTNLGVALLELDEAALAAAKPVFIGFAKLKQGGKIWNALQQSGLALETRGEWTWIARDAALFEQLKSGDAVTAHIARPQIEEIKVWGRATPGLLSALKARVMPALETKLAERPAEDRQALTAYVDVLWSYLAQIHSGDASIDLGDTGLTIAYSAQFLPDSALGTWLRYPHGPEPKIAASVPSDGLFNIVMRQNAPAQAEFFEGLFDALIAVDYPKVSSPLKAHKESFISLIKSSDGGAVVTMDMSMPVGGKTPEISLFGVYAGHFTETQVFDYYRQSAAFTDRFTNALFTSMSSLTPMQPASSMKSKLSEDVLTIEGVRFGTFTTTITTGTQEPVTTVQHYGVADGNYIFASDEASLRAKLPAILSKQKVAKPVSIALTGDEALIGTVQGDRIVDMVVEGLKLDLSDADTQAQVNTLKQGFAAADSPRFAVSAAQAKGVFTFSIPYQFISQSVRLGQFAAAHKTSE